MDPNINDLVKKSNKNSKKEDSDLYIKRNDKQNYYLQIVDTSGVPSKTSDNDVIIAYSQSVYSPSKKFNLEKIEAEARQRSRCKSIHRVAKNTPFDDYYIQDSARLKNKYPKTNDVRRKYFSVEVINKWKKIVKHRVSHDLKIVRKKTGVAKTEKIGKFLIEREYADYDSNVKHRSEMEDFINIKNDDPNYKLYVLCDGHGGELAAKITVEELPKIFAECLKNVNTSQGDIESFHREVIDQSISKIEMFLKKKNVRPDYIPPSEPLLDDEEDEDNYLEELEEGGCTLNVVFICLENSERVLYSANVGDSRTVLIQKNSFLRLSYDHKATDPDEVKRVKEVKGKIIDKRFYRMLAITRSIADFGLKRPGYNGLIYKPHITRKVIQPDDFFVVIASDGLWDVITDEALFELFLSNSFYQKQKDDLAYLLNRQAIDYGTSDNLSCIVIQLNKI